MNRVVESASVSVMGLRHAFRLGCTEEERAYPQIVSIDIVAELADTSSVESDSLEETLDYVAIDSAIGELAKAGEWKLIERLAGDISDTIFGLNAQLLELVTVRITKNVFPNADGVSVEVTKLRSEPLS